MTERDASAPVASFPRITTETRDHDHTWRGRDDQAHVVVHFADIFPAPNTERKWAPGSIRMTPLTALKGMIMRSLRQSLSLFSHWFSYVARMGQAETRSVQLRKAAETVADQDTTAFPIPSTIVATIPNADQSDCNHNGIG